jgi:hypothetical protein
MTKKSNISISEETEGHFGMHLSFYRIAGVEILPRKHSKLYTMYALCASVCTYGNSVAMILDVLEHRDDLQYCMSSTQTMCAAITALWIHQF